MFLLLAINLWDIIPPISEPSADKSFMFRQLALARMAANMTTACFSKK